MTPANHTPPHTTPSQVTEEMPQSPFIPDTQGREKLGILLQLLSSVYSSRARFTNLEMEGIVGAWGGSTRASGIDVWGRVQL